MNKFNRKRLMTVNDPTLISNMSSLYEPADFRESIDVPSELNSPKMFRISANKWEDLQNNEDDFKVLSGSYSPTYKTRQKMMVNYREFSSEIDPWKTFDVQPGKSAKNPNKINSFCLKEPQLKASDLGNPNMQEEVIKYIENLELQNMELQNNIASLQESMNGKHNFN